MRKLIAAIIISALTLALAGCSGNNNSGSSASSGSSTTSSDTTSNQDSSGSSGTSSESAPDNGSDVSSDTSSESSSNGEYADNAHRLADVVQNAVEFPAMGEVTETEDILNIFGINTDLCVEYAFIQNLMSVHLNEIIVLLPAAECEDELLEQLTNRFEYIRNEAAFYPAQEASAAGAVMGTTENGYLYLIVHENGADAQEALLAAIG
ncbi:MAG: DUF4358 domain-containing protein [Oscillospiraceae bacterium]